MAVTPHYVGRSRIHLSFDFNMSDSFAKRNIIGDIISINNKCTAPWLEG